MTTRRVSLARASVVFPAGVTAGIAALQTTHTVGIGRAAYGVFLGAPPVSTGHLQGSLTAAVGGGLSLPEAPVGATAASTMGEYDLAVAAYRSGAIRVGFAARYAGFVEARLGFTEAALEQIDDSRALSSATVQADRAASRGRR